MLFFAGMMAGAASLAISPAGAQQTIVTSGPQVSAGGPMMSRPGVGNPGIGTTMMRRSWGHRVDGRWWGGSQAPGGWASYRRPITGFVLPGYWLQPTYYISDYGAYGLPAPAAGYGWSRYYDDAVMTDRYGRVYDSRIGYDWDRYGGYDDGPAPRGDDGRVLGGAVIGGVTGGLLGSAVAGPGNRTGGAILGAGLGAIAGGAIASSSSGDRDGHYYGGERRWASDAERLRAEARERKAWAKERVRLDKLARQAGYANYDDYLRRQERLPMVARPMAGAPHWAMRGGAEGHAAPGGHIAGAPRIETQVLPGYVANGYYFPGETITTVTIAPSTVTTTKTSYVTTTRRVTVKPRTKILKRKVVRCTCN
ncbi:RcnB family protein [Sphingobium nicotianae]|uniref:RcnB family protein n=1 Tax=Sphingobium nicotianae TaxID=2782607 RepID=UPI002032D81F|nr:RcnB family protein [Sphingobium nicotianae]